MNNMLHFHGVTTVVWFTLDTLREDKQADVPDEDVDPLVQRDCHWYSNEREDVPDEKVCPSVERDSAWNYEDNMETID